MATIAAGTRRPSIGRGSLRVQGWLYTVLWPLHEALVRELVHLEAGDATWRHTTERLEGLRTPAAHLDAAGRVNLEDLIAVDSPDLRAAIDECTAAQTRLADAARQAHDELAIEVREAISRTRHRFHDGDADAVETIAEDLVNRTVDRHIGSREAMLIDVLRDHLPYLRNGHHPALEAAFRDAVDATRALLVLVESARERLCDRYDLPPAPVVVHAPRGRATTAT
jgi:hypothetical protein